MRFRTVNIEEKLFPGLDDNSRPRVVVAYKESKDGTLKVGVAFKGPLEARFNRKFGQAIAAGRLKSKPVIIDPQEKTHFKDRLYQAICQAAIEKKIKWFILKDGKDIMPENLY